ncbi:hypothetical protein LXL04_025845 [Taraxacum kok-saghyz]
MDIIAKKDIEKDRTKCGPYKVLMFAGWSIFAKWLVLRLKDGQNLLQITTLARHLIQMEDPGQCLPVRRQNWLRNKVWSIRRQREFKKRRRSCGSLRKRVSKEKWIKKAELEIKTVVVAVNGQCFRLDFEQYITKEKEEEYRKRNAWVIEEKKFPLEFPE